MVVSVDIVSADELHEVAELYRETDYRGGILPSDRIVAARSNGGLVGACRLAREHDTLVLRGMRVQPALRRQGIGSRLLYALQVLDEPCYCIPHAHLQAFYGRVGFVPLQADEAPAFLRARAEKYRAEGLDVVVMRREPTAGAHAAHGSPSAAAPDTADEVGTGSSKPFTDHFAAVAADYGAARPRYPAELFAWLAATAPATGLAWDCATGGGQAAAGLAAHFDRVIATDASRAQIEAATPHKRVEYRVAPAEASGLFAGSVDLVTVAQALHWFDVARFFAEARRVLAPGGVLAVWTYGASTIDDESVDALVRSFYRDTVEPYWPPERAWVDVGYRGIDIPFDPVTAPEFPMSVAWTAGP